MKATQYFTPEYLELCKQMSLKDRLEYLENFRKLREVKSPSKLISMKVPENLLELFKKQCELHGVKYQTQIKKLMDDWLTQKLK